MRHFLLSLILLLCPFLSITLFAEAHAWDSITDKDKLRIIEAKQQIKIVEADGPNAHDTSWRLIQYGFYPAIKSPDIETTGLIAKALLQIYERGISTYETCDKLKQLKTKLETMKVLDVGGPISQEAYLGLTNNTAVNRPYSAIYKEMKESITKDIHRSKENQANLAEMTRLTERIKSNNKEIDEIDERIKNGDRGGDGKNSTADRAWANYKAGKREEITKLRKEIESSSDYLRELKSKSAGNPLPRIPEWYQGIGEFATVDATTPFQTNAQLYIIECDKNVGIWEKYEASLKADEKAANDVVK